MGRIARNDVFAAIADPTRRRLLERMQDAERSVAELTEGAQMTIAAVSLHLQVLHRAGLVQQRIAGRRRLYRLDPAPLREVSDWTDRLSAFLGDRIDRLQQLAEDINARTDRSQH